MGCLLVGVIILTGCNLTTQPSPLTDTIEPTASETSTPESVLTMPVSPSLTDMASATGTPVLYGILETDTPHALAFTPYNTFTATLKPTITRTATEGVTPRFTRTFTLTPTRTSTAQPADAVLRISRPGLYSKIISPYKIEAMVTPGEDGFVYLSLVGEDQRVIFTQDLNYRQAAYSRFMIVPSLEFSIPAVAETARLILETRDMFGRPIALSSVDVILLSIGENETNPSQRLFQSFLIDTPRGGSVIQGGKLVLSGRAAPLNGNPLIIELLGEDGEVLVSRQIQVDMPTGEQTYAAFVVELPYTVSAETQARLSIRQESDNRLPGTIALTSIAVSLLP